ncbi:2-hydroxychromene-2-carboxylate isomerase [Notoacmeibacter marinus]|uniref:2-hydroxychromene-2-carboxylate isomerase n=1 Tax=Notoacmeibacter marinus TaxID=1876515 RepID=UPI0013B05D70|nr:DsbA family protein [Notoacmeibacter marinus]
MSRTIEFWYDLISPYSYAAFGRLAELPEDVELHPRALLFGAVLAHYRHLGPAELAPKRIFTYRQAVHLIASLGLPVSFPPRHPFNPLGANRLLAGAHDGAGATLDEVRSAFTFVFGHGGAVDTVEGLAALTEHLGLEPELATMQQSKDRLKANTRGAIDAGVFGVPTFVPLDNDGARGPVFWGVDGMGLLIDWLTDPMLFEKQPYAGLETIEIGVRRERS